MMLPVKILLVGAFGSGALEHQFIRVLSHAGVQVSLFNMQQKVNTLRNKSIINKVLLRTTPRLLLQHLNEEIIANVTSIQPQVVIVFKGMDLFPETIETLRNTKNVLVCNYNPDHPFHYFSSGSGNNFVKQSIPFFHIHFSYSKKIVEALQQQYKVNAYWIPFGYDETRTKQIQPTTNNDITFIGAYDKERANILGSLSVIPLKIYGPASWKKAAISNQKLKHSFQDCSLYNEAYDTVTQNALCCINLLRKQNLIESSHNMRTFEVPGVGGLMIANRTEEHQYFFEEDKEAIFFDTSHELNHKIQAIQKGLYKVQAIKEAAAKRSIRSGYSYHHRITALYDVINKYI